MGRKAFDRGRTRRHMKFRSRSRSPRTSVREPPMLVGNSRDNNFHQWTELMLTKCTREFGKALAGILVTNRLDLPRRPELEDYGIVPEDEDELGVFKEDYMLLKSAIGEYTRRLALIEDNKPRMAAVLWERLSKESIEMVCSHQGFVKDKHQFEPLHLWNAIRETHRSGSSAPDAASRQDESRHAYQSLSKVFARVPLTSWNASDTLKNAAMMLATPP